MPVTAKDKGEAGLTVTHDVLYSKARYVLNKRYIKRPWFNLHPFLEKTDESVDLENYLPDESKYIQSLESLVLCESYRSEHPLDTREIAVDGFFDYLNSDQWSGGCSVRVLEGQLLQQLLICLYRLEKDNHAVRHTTYALAKNKRQRTGCCKLADKAAYGFVEDTLLIEFAYFGRLTKETPNPITQNPMEYLRLGIPESVDESTTQCVTPPIVEEEFPRKRRGIYVWFWISDSVPSYLKTAEPKASDKNNDTKKENGDSEERLYGEDLYLSEERRKPDKKPNSTKAKLKKKKEASDKDNAEKKENGDSEEELYGEEFYLSEERRKPDKKPNSTKAKLKKKKVELQTRRQEVRDFLASIVLPPDGPVLPPMPPLDIADNKVVHNTIKMPDELPSFEEFIKILREDEYYDPRYSNKVRLKRKQIAQRYYMYIAKGQSRCSSLYERNSPGSLLASVYRFRQLHKINTSRGSRVGVGLSTVQEKSQENGSISNPANIDPANIAEEVLGVTDSEPCKEHCLAMSSSSNEKGNEKTSNRQKGKRRKSSTVLDHKRSSINASRSKKDISKSQLLPASSRSQVQSTSSPALPPIFPKATLCDEEVDYSETDSQEEEEETDDETYIFDAGKLNLKYSSERLRKKQKKKKKKPVFYDILAKYYKMQDAMSAFRKGSMTREVKHAKVRAKRLTLAGFFRGAVENDFKPIDEFTLGKLKKFNFLDTRARKTTPAQKLENLSRVDFAPPCLVNFCSSLEGALERFVVRREIVVSELPTYYKSATSVTFTRKSCFVNKHKDC